MGFSVSSTMPLAKAWRVSLNASVTGCAPKARILWAMTREACTRGQIAKVCGLKQRAVGTHLLEAVVKKTKPYQALST